LLEESSPFRAGPFYCENKCRMIRPNQCHLSKWQDGVTSPLSRLAPQNGDGGTPLTVGVWGKARRPDTVNASYCRIGVASANPIQAYLAAMTARARAHPCAPRVIAPPPTPLDASVKSIEDRRKPARQRPKDPGGEPGPRKRRVDLGGGFAGRNGDRRSKP
jgi:hypothetical protein